MCQELLIRDLTDFYEIGIIVLILHMTKLRIKKIQLTQQVSGRVQIQAQVCLDPE